MNYYARLHIIQRKTNNLEKRKKIFILDPYLAKTLSLWTDTEYLESSLYEWIVQSPLKRRFG